MAANPKAAGRKLPRADVPAGTSRFVSHAGEIGESLLGKASGHSGRWTVASAGISDIVRRTPPHTPYVPMSQDRIRLTRPMGGGAQSGSAPTGGPRRRRRAHAEADVVAGSHCPAQHQRSSSLLGEGRRRRHPPDHREAESSDAFCRNRRPRPPSSSLNVPFQSLRRPP